MALRLVSRETKRIDIGEDDFIIVKTDISRRDFNRLISALPPDISTENVNFEIADTFTIGVFNALVVDWSVVDVDGEPVEVSEENYQSLSRAAASLIDAAVMSHFNSLTPDEETSTKSEESSS